jgi:hypothetical protein
MNFAIENDEIRNIQRAVSSQHPAMPEPENLPTAAAV